MADIQGTVEAQPVQILQRLVDHLGIQVICGSFHTEHGCHDGLLFQCIEKLTGEVGNDVAHHVVLDIGHMGVGAGHHQCRMGDAFAAQLIQRTNDLYLLASHVSNEGEIVIYRLQSRNQINISVEQGVLVMAVNAVRKLLDRQRHLQMGHLFHAIRGGDHAGHVDACHILLRQMFFL